MKLLITFACSLFISIPSEKNCRLLPDGYYEVTSTRMSNESYHVRVSKNKYFEYFKNGNSVEAELDSIWECTFKLRYLGQSMLATNKNLAQQAFKQYFGDQCIIINEIRGDSIPYRISHTGNLHITVDGGYYIKR